MSNGAAGNYVNYQILTKIKIDNRQYFYQQNKNFDFLSNNF
jgi:hypothetical protein